MLGGHTLGTWDGTSPGSPTTNFLLTDTLGSVVSSFNNLPSGAAVVLGDQVYGPYGNRRVQQGTISTSKGFTGQFTDFVAGLDYYGARFYDPVVGVFVSADTIQGNAQGMNPYGYVGGNPETNTDPTGNRVVCNDFGGGCGGGSSSGEASNVHLSLPPSVVAAVQSFRFPQLPIPTIPIIIPNIPVPPAPAAAPQSKPTVMQDPPPNSCGAGQLLCGNYGVYYAAHIGPFTIPVPGEWTPLDHVDFGAGDEYGQGTGGSATDEGAPCSFTSQTKVTTEMGKQAIGTLKVGEKVWAYNPKTKKMELQPILHVWIHTDNDLVDLTISSVSYAQQGKAAKRGSEVVHANQKHPFLTVEKGFLPVRQIKLGMHVVEADGQVGVISGWKIVPGIQMMYNLEVAHDHTLTVGVGQWVVHNCDIGPIKVSEEDLQIIQEHLSNRLLAEDDGSIAPENQAMIARLQKALSNGTEVTGADANFYLHELYERTLMKDAPYTQAAYDAAHAASLKRYGVSPFAVYHPDVIKQFPERFNSNWLKYWGRER